MTLKLRHRPESLSGSVVMQRLGMRMPGALRGAHAETLLSDLSIDSLDTVELLCSIEDEFDVRFDQAQFQQLRTVGELADAVAQSVRSHQDGTGRVRGRS